ncbi:hypothetical protein D9613_011089 [Agrocybe pediades]|uniref:Uncharacterized protein n=1 Tax=Agrocybe pediades TaxID=84607 RepID=A0A8H4VKB4_9AGAR|nr:hypothetical protein D9613_011089 [Agrocybe pediades]
MSPITEADHSLWAGWTGSGCSGAGRPSGGLVGNLRESSQVPISSSLSDFAATLARLYPRHFPTEHPPIPILTDYSSTSAADGSWEAGWNDVGGERELGQGGRQSINGGER